MVYYGKVNYIEFKVFPPIGNSNERIDLSNEEGYKACLFNCCFNIDGRMLWQKK